MVSSELENKVGNRSSATVVPRGGPSVKVNVIGDCREGGESSVGCSVRPEWVLGVDEKGEILSVRVGQKFLFWP